MERVPAVILAGAKSREALAVQAGVEYKALALIDGRPMVAHVAAALAAAESVSEVLVVGPDAVAAALPGYRHVPDAGSFIGNMAAGAAACAGAEHCLISTCDIPFLTGAVVDAFVDEARARRVDLAYPIVPLARCQERFPGMPRTSMRIREGRFTGGNAALVRTAFIARNAATIEEAFAARKQPARLVGMIGWDLLVRLLLARKLPAVLPLALLEARVGRMMGGTVAGIPFSCPEIGADIDKPEDFAAIEA